MATPDQLRNAAEQQTQYAAALTYAGFTDAARKVASAADLLNSAAADIAARLAGYAKQRQEAP